MPGLKHSSYHEMSAIRWTDLSMPELLACMRWLIWTSNIVKWNMNRTKYIIFCQLIILNKIVHR